MRSTPLRIPTPWFRVLVAGAALAATTSMEAGESVSLPPVHERTEEIVKGAIRETLAEFSTQNLKADELAVTLIDLSQSNQPRRGSHRGTVQIYPASIVKLFYLVACHQWLADGRISDTPELRRALSDMVVHSYNEATHYIVDVLTGTTSGPELTEDELMVWMEKREAVNRYFATLGYSDVVAHKKPWCEGPYGREIQAIRARQPNRNLLTTDDTALLLSEIVNGRAVSRDRCDAMLQLLERDLTQKTPDPDGEGTGFTGPGLPPGSLLWSKAGWTSQTRHDAAYVKLPSGKRFILVTFTTGHANDREIIPVITRNIVSGMAREDR